MNEADSLSAFHPIVRSWFARTFGEPSPPQKLGWPSISAGKNTLIVAPTGSGKTLAAFLWCINHLVEEEIEGSDEKHGVRVLYVSPLKALNNDIHRNLDVPLRGIHEEATSQGLGIPRLRSAVRTGDTTQAERASILRNPPHILITTPESLYLMLSSPRARKIFRGVRYLIVDEIHSISGNKRGVHLSLSLERLERAAGDSFVRIGLSATQRPLDTIARFLGGMEWKERTLVPREVTIVDAGYRKEMDLQVVCVTPDFSDLSTESIWTLVFPRLLEAIYRHRTTLIFVNNRRLAEQAAARLNELIQGHEHTFNSYAVPRVSAPVEFSRDESEVLVQAYHGSMSRSARERMESDLKAGRLRVLVATSALELGIDIGSIDLVIQIQSPKGIARGLQRVGRSGHLVSSTSKGRIYVTHRHDLLESAVVARAMEEHDIEETHVPENCLDVLAQQIVSMVSVEDWDVDELFDLIRGSYCYRALSEKAYESVLGMIGGRYTNEAFRELRPRVSWNKVRNTLSALPGSSHVAISNAGTIPDRGYFGVYLEDLKTKVGEIDEEFVYESRAGDTFFLGSNVWKMLSIDANRIIVGPAPGQPGRMPFWRGEGIGRSFELGTKLGELIQELGSDGGGEPDRIRSRFPVDAYSARNIIDYVRQQKTATGELPTHRRIVVEGFRDEIGDPRIVVHSCFGRGVNGLLGLVLSHRLQERLGTEIQMLYNDDGILFRCSDVERLPLDLFAGLSPGEAQEIVLEEVARSPLFASLFRQNAERALLLPKARVGKRTPLWLQRLRAGDLLQIATTYEDFPIVIETVRDSLNDVLDFEHFKEVMARIESGEIGIHAIQTEFPSPFASTVLFDFIAVYIYERDKAKGGAAGQARTLNRELLSQVVGIDSVKAVVRPEAVSRVEEQLQYTSDTRKARSAEELCEIFLRLGELTHAEALERSSSKDEKYLNALLQQGSVIPVSMGGRKYFIATEDLPVYLTIAGVSDDIISHVPEEFRTTPLQRAESLRFVIGRTLHGHTPLTASGIAGRFGLDSEECLQVLRSFSADENIVEGMFTIEEGETQWCYRPNLEWIHHASISILRKEIRPSTFNEYTRLLSSWQHRDPATQVSGEEGLQTILEKLEGYLLPGELWESEVLRSRMEIYDPMPLRSFSARGEIVCAGSGSGKTQWLFRGDGACFLGDRDELSAGLSAAGTELYKFLHESGASFLTDIREGTSLSLAALNKAIAELFWRGLITNDVVDEVLNVRRYKTLDESPLPDERMALTNPRRNPLRSFAMASVRKAIKASPGWNGRWSLLHTRRVLGDKASMEDRARRQAEQLLLRYGIVAREIAKREENLVPWALLALEFQKMELRGEIRRGYFVEGLSGMQFALPAAVEMLRSLSGQKSAGGTGRTSVINACDPANPFGPGVELRPFRGSEPPRTSRHPLNHFIFENGSPVVWLENVGSRITILGETPPQTLADSLREFISYIRASHKERGEIVVEFIDGERPSAGRHAEVLQEVGFYRDRAQTMRLDLR
ncbi:MAG TPA: DEAD/DEAH box helicase [Bacteroidota bacterium]|nr:DEAD/DEAH box helicase [Bacteroidota bacterium]